MSSLTLDRMRPEDLDEVLAIERASFTMPWSRGAFLYEIQQNRVARCWVGRLPDGHVAPAWVYFYNAPLGQAPRISSGDYLEHVKVR